MAVRSRGAVVAGLVALTAFFGLAIEQDRAAAEPLSPVLEVTGNTSVRLRWSPVAGATRYYWQIRTCGGTTIVSSDTAALEKTKSNLGAGCYRGRVRPRFNTIYGAWEESNEVDVGGPPVASIPPGFVDEAVAAVPAPTDVTFTPDGRLIITTQGGRVHVARNGILVPTPALDISASVCTTRERGILGAVPHPNFATNGRVFLFYTPSGGGTCPSNTADIPVNRVSSFVLGADDRIDPATEQVIVDKMPSPGGHNAGDLVIIGQHLYISVGDGMCQLTDFTRCQTLNGNSRRLDIPNGKILRVNLDGSVPAGNPYTGPGSRRCTSPSGPEPGTGPCQETWVSGLRNPFRIAVRPADNALLINDVGGEAWEEINVAVPGGDYGWNNREGRCAVSSLTDCPATPPGLTDPYYAYSHATGCQSITGGAYAPASWPVPYGGSYLFADYVCGGILRLDETGPSPSHSIFLSGLGDSSAVSMTKGPAPGGEAIYYTNYLGGGSVHRLRYVGVGNRPPTAALTGTPTSGLAPLLVHLDASGSTDPDGDALTYSWNFGDGATATTNSPTIDHTYTTDALRLASVVVSDPGGATSSAATLAIAVGNRAPAAPTIAGLPAAGFRVGEQLHLTGSATDPEDGAVPAERLTWEVILHHGEHTHPYVFPTTGASVDVTGPAPEDLPAAPISWLDVKLTATDSAGVTTTTIRRLDARRVVITFASDPTGLLIDVEGIAQRTPASITSWAGYALIVSARTPQDFNGSSYNFLRWDDATTANRTIVTPDAPTTYTARYQTTSPTTGAPTVSLQPMGGLKVSISWNAISGAVRYYWEVRRCGGSAVVKSDTTSTLKTANVPSTGCYYAVVRARFANGTYGPTGKSANLTI